MKTPLTKEERAQRIKERCEERRKEKAEAERLFPSARLSNDKQFQSSWVQVVLDSQYPNELTIRVHGEKALKKEPDHDGVLHAGIWLADDPHELARLIRGLTARFNDMMKDLNATVEGTPALAPAKLIPEGWEAP